MVPCLPIFTCNFAGLSLCWLYKQKWHHTQYDCNNMSKISIYILAHVFCIFILLLTCGDLPQCNRRYRIGAQIREPQRPLDSAPPSDSWRQTYKNAAPQHSRYHRLIPVGERLGFDSPRWECCVLFDWDQKNIAILHILVWSLILHWIHSCALYWSTSERGNTGWFITVNSGLPSLTCHCAPSRQTVNSG
jgi:hypothetical protein